MDSTSLLVRPFVEKEKVVKYAREEFGLEIENPHSVKELDSYDDRNFFVMASAPKACNSGGEVFSKYVFKVMNSKFSYSHDFLDASVDILEHMSKKLGQSSFKFPRNIPDRNGNFKVLKEFDVPFENLAKQDSTLVAKIKTRELQGDEIWRVVVDENGGDRVVIRHYIRLLSYVDGTPMMDTDVSEDSLFQVGCLAGTVCNALVDYSHPGLVAKQDIWDLKNLLLLHSPRYLDAMKEPNKRKMIEEGMELFEENVMSIADQLPKQSIHSDINAGNVIMCKKNLEDVIMGLIDFGDVTYSYRVFEISICIAYISMLKPDNSLRAAGIILSGYLSKTTLTEQELKVLYYCVIGRLVQSLTIGNYQYVLLDPGNEYLLDSSKQGWKVLDTFLRYKDNVEEFRGILLGSKKEFSS